MRICSRVIDCDAFAVETNYTFHNLSAFLYTSSLNSKRLICITSLKPPLSPKAMGPGFHDLCVVETQICPSFTLPSSARGYFKTVRARANWAVWICNSVNKCADSSIQSKDTICKEVFGWFCIADRNIVPNKIVVITQHQIRNIEVHLKHDGVW